MRIHCVSYNDEDGDLTLIEYQCSMQCMWGTIEAFLKENDIDPMLLLSLMHNEAGSHKFDDNTSIDWGGCPGGNETQYDVYCSNCEILLWQGLDADGSVSNSS